MSISRTNAYPAVRLAGSCGIASGVLLLATPALPAPDGVTNTLWLLGWLLLLGFFAGIATLTRGTGDRTAWLSPAISAAAAVLVSVHLINVGIEYTANDLSKTSPAHEPLHEVGGALFTLGMLPFGVAVVASAAVGLAGRVLPRWLAVAGLVVGLTALVSGTMLGSETAWGFLLGIIWVFTGGIALAMRRALTVAAPQMATTAGQRPTRRRRLCYRAATPVAQPKPFAAPQACPQKGAPVTGHPTGRVIRDVLTSLGTGAVGTARQRTMRLVKGGVNGDGRHGVPR
jgi:hypothetical protein